MSPYLEITVAGEFLQLWAEKALFWPREKILFIADLHMSETSQRQRSGGVAPDVTSTELTRLSRLLKETQAARLVILGDLFDAREGITANLTSSLRQWRTLHPHLVIWLLQGNHDRSAGLPPEALRIQSFDRPVFLDPFVFQHEPGESKQGYVLSGHWHPSVPLPTGNGAAKQGPCFLFRTDYAVLPSFGTCTDLDLIERRDSDRVYLPHENSILKLS